MPTVLYCSSISSSSSSSSSFSSSSSSRCLLPPSELPTYFGPTHRWPLSVLRFAPDISCPYAFSVGRMMIGVVRVKVRVRVRVTVRVTVRGGVMMAW